MRMINMGVGYDDGHGGNTPHHSIPVIAALGNARVIVRRHYTVNLNGQMDARIFYCMRMIVLQSSTLPPTFHGSTAMQQYNPCFIWPCVVRGTWVDLFIPCGTHKSCSLDAYEYPWQAVALRSARLSHAQIRCTSRWY